MFSSIKCFFSGDSAEKAKKTDASLVAQFDTHEKI